MPVNVEFKIRPAGWKAEENERFGTVAVAKFISEEKRLFEWAPTLKDCRAMKSFCDLVLALDEKNKHILAIGDAMKELNVNNEGDPSCRPQ